MATVPTPTGQEPLTAATVEGGGRGDCGQVSWHVSLETDHGLKRFALLGPGRGGPWRLIGEYNLLGRKIRVGCVHPESGEPRVGTAQVLWTIRLGDGLYENGTGHCQVE